MSTRLFLPGLAGLAILLASCEKPPAPPAVELPQIARPVLTLTAGAGNRIAIPRTALTERGSITVVFVLNERNEARERMVRAGHSLNGRAEILAGLRGDERLVLGDLATVRDGYPIRTVKNSK